MMPPVLNLRASAQLTRRFQIVSERDGGHARARKRATGLVGPKAPPPTDAGGATDALVTGVEGTVGAQPPSRQV